MRQIIGRMTSKHVIDIIRRWGSSAHAAAIKKETLMLKEQRDEAEHAMSSTRDLNRKKGKRQELTMQHERWGNALRTMRQVLSTWKSQDLVRSIQRWSAKARQRKHVFELGAKAALHRSALRSGRLSGNAATFGLANTPLELAIRYVELRSIIPTNIPMSLRSSSFPTCVCWK